MNAVEPHIHPSWKQALAKDFAAPYFADLKSFLVHEIEAGKIIYPPAPDIFAAFDHCPFEAVKVVILGQDPYHGPGQAHGLAFSVNPGVRIPPSLRNIYQELESDLQISPAQHGCLTAWADQGVLLLNATLTVESRLPGSHQGHGWETFTDQAISALSDSRSGLVFLLWGNFARSKKDLIDTQKHSVLEAPHPSPFSAHSGFFGCQHFSKANQYLKKQGKTPINWELPKL